MDILSKNKILSLLVLILIILNMALIGSFWYFNRIQHFEKPHREKPNDKKLEDIFREELSFDKNQTDSLEILFKDYKSKEDEMREEIKKIHNEINDEVLKNTSASDIQNKFDKLGHKKAELDKFSYDFFIALRSLCKDEQKQKFDELLKEIIKIINKPKQKN